MANHTAPLPVQDRSAEFPGAVNRIARRYPILVSEQVRGLDALEDLAAMQAIIEKHTAETVRALRSEEGGAYSWSQIAEVLGTTRQYAMKKYGANDTSPRTAGGQPAHLR